MRFVDEHRDQFAVALLLRVLDVEESTYYGWIKQVAQPCEREMVDRGLLSNIYEIGRRPGARTGRTGCGGNCAATVSTSAASGSSG